jgi:hypothetical protein
MHVKPRGAALAVAALTLALGTAAVTAGPASASSGGCAFSNGCATLGGVDAVGNSVSMDAKYQKPTEMLIGYPDIPGDGATSFDAVIHYTPSAPTTSYTDTGFTLSPTFTSIPCLLTTDPKVTPSAAGDLLTAGGHELTVQSTTGTVTAAPTSGSSIVLGGTGTLEIDEQYADDGNSCVAAYHATYPPLAIAPSSPDTASLIFPTSPGGSTWTFLDEDTGGSFSFSGLPAGITPSGGSLTADTSTAVPGTYTNVGVTYTATTGAVFTATFTLVVSGIKSVSPGAQTPYYTFVYARNGVWSNECVTNNNGSGALWLQTCTLGKNHYQDFFALNNAGAPQGNLQSASGEEYHIQNFLATYGGPDSCLQDLSSLNPATPESDATDETLVPHGRQLSVNASCAAAGPTWSWRT